MLRSLHTNTTNLTKGNDRSFRLLKLSLRTKRMNKCTQNAATDSNLDDSSKVRAGACDDPELLIAPPGLEGDSTPAKLEDGCGDESKDHSGEPANRVPVQLQINIPGSKVWSPLRMCLTSVYTRTMSDAERLVQVRHFINGLLVERCTEGTKKRSVRRARGGRRQ